uniref:TadE/TadG family type IV pilus assembly protein n=1 Tax=Pararhizobium sp. IMCC3301 TaxID=3067904 RepID=UPI00274121BD|nr:TadE/TadG family type IV pilus assembly protein [Pararhizobium sp. IMCC3301]
MITGAKHCKHSPTGTLSRLAREQEGYALAMTLVALPLVLAVSAFVIDGSRVANLHTDIQNAVDAMALAGARELDGGDDAIARSQAAIAAMNGNQAWFGDNGTALGMGTKVNLTFSSGDGASDVSVSFLGAIPASDDTAIGAGACVAGPGNTADCLVKGSSAAEQSANALFVRVVATPRAIRTIFPLPGLGNDTLSVSAEAVATYSAVICDITPLFICNPFENFQGNPIGNDLSFNKNFAQGNMYGRQINLSYGKNGQVGPGNFGFLRTLGNGASALAEALATSSATCYRKKGLDTKPGANVGPVTTGLNTRFGIYPNGQSFPSSEQAYAPDVNVRKGQSQGSGNNGKKSGAQCTNYDPEQNSTTFGALPFPEGDAEVDIGGATMSASSDWDIETYWDITHGNYSEPPEVSGYTPPALPVTIPKSFPNLPGSTTPSRYDVYNYEIDNNLVNDAGPNGETGAPQCQAPSVTPQRDRRTLVAAVVECNALQGELQGSATNIPASGFARMFLTRPAVASGNDRTIAMEVIDIAGDDGLGSMDDFFREEAELVR